MKHVAFLEAVREAGGIQIGGLTGLGGFATAYGPSIDMVRRRVGRTLGNLQAEAMQYRADVGAGVAVTYRILNEGGWLTEEPQHAERLPLRAG